MKLPSYPWRYAHLAALWAYGVSQPVFSMLKGNPEFLVVRGSTRMDVIGFALLVALVPPLVVIALEVVTSVVSKTLAGALHMVGIWCFGFLAALQLVRMLDPERGAALLLPIAPAALIVILYMRSRAFQSFLSISLALPVLGLLSFVATVPLAVDDAAGANVKVATRTPVVLVVMDEFAVSSLLKPDGSIDALRYPNFARLAHDGTWYPRATTVADFTTDAVPAIATGRLPEQGALPTLADHPDNLFTLLGERYALRVHEEATRLCPSRYCPDARAAPPVLDRYRGLLYDVGVGYLYRVLPQALRHNLPPIGDRWGGFGDGADTRDRLLGALDQADVGLAIERTDHTPRAAFAQFLRTIEPDAPDRTLFFLHLMLPHAPWRLLPSGREYGNAWMIDGISDDAFNQWDDVPGLVDQALQRHLLQVGYTDRLLGVLLRRLESTRLYDRSLVVVTADHGVSFHPGGSRRLATPDNIADIAGVPLFVKYPGERRGRVDRRDAKTIDIVPTIADVIGVRMPWHVDGKSLRGKPVIRPVAIMNHVRGAVTANADAVAAGVLATARRNGTLFGEGDDSMYRLGPHTELLGRSVVALAAPDLAGASISLESDTLFLDVEKASGFVPARVVGEIRGLRLPQGTGLAVAVDGRVAAMTRSYELEGRSRFAALVPESAFHDGANSIDVYALEATGSDVRLARLGGSVRAPQYALSADAATILLPSGKRAVVAAGRLDGKVDTSVVEGDTLRVRGWAVDLRKGSPVDRVVVFSGRRLVSAVDTTVIRWDVPEVASNVALERAGWVAELPRRDIEGGDLRAFAIRGGVATELAWPGGSGGKLVAVSRAP